MFDAIPFNPGAGFSGIPEITRVEYDLWVLRITCDFDGHREPVYLEFQNVEGFRVLDEGQLSAFWVNGPRAPGWLWEVKSGGWFELESNRSDFIMGLTFSLGGIVNSPREFIALGVSDCVSVITWDEPRAYAARP